MSEPRIDDFHLDLTILEMLASKCFRDGVRPKLLREDRLYNETVERTWIEPKCVSQWMDDVTDRAAAMLADWRAELDGEEVGVAA